MTGEHCPARDGGPAVFTVRLPVLRRPPGWRSLDEPTLRQRATQLYLASLPPQGGPGRIAVPPRQAETHPDAAPAASRGGAAPGMAGLLNRWRLGLASAVSALFGWGAARAGSASDHESFDRFDRHFPAADPMEAVAPLDAVGVRGPRLAHEGWVLAAALALVGVLAAMLITTLDLKNRQPAALAGALRAAASPGGGKELGPRAGQGGAADLVPADTVLPPQQPFEPAGAGQVDVGTAAAGPADLAGAADAADPRKARP